MVLSDLHTFKKTNEKTTLSCMLVPPSQAPIPAQAALYLILWKDRTRSLQK